MKIFVENKVAQLPAREVLDELRVVPDVAPVGARSGHREVLDEPLQVLGVGGDIHLADLRDPAHEGEVLVLHDVEVNNDDAPLIARVDVLNPLCTIGSNITDSTGLPCVSVAFWFTADGSAAIFDDDEPGQKGAAEVAQRLGIDRCKLVKLGAKDANQWLQDGATLSDIHAVGGESRVAEVARMLGGEKLSGMVHAQTMLHGPRGTPTPRARQP
jgi:hypothetical protein